jgi:hypothetical protein
MPWKPKKFSPFSESKVAEGEELVLVVEEPERDRTATGRAKEVELKIIERAACQLEVQRSQAERVVGIVNRISTNFRK